MFKLVSKNDVKEELESIKEQLKAHSEALSDIRGAENAREERQKLINYALQNGWRAVVTRSHIGDMECVFYWDSKCLNREESFYYWPYRVSQLLEKGYILIKKEGSHSLYIHKEDFDLIEQDDETDSE